MPNPGDLICGRLRLLRYAPPGFGSPIFGPAFVARDQTSGEESHVTMVASALLPTSVHTSRFMAGANALVNLRHPALVRLAFVDREEKYAVVGAEILPNAKSLASMKGKRAPEAIVHKRAIETVRALAHLHQKGVVHGIPSLETVVLWEGAGLLWQHGIAPLVDPLGLAEAARRAAAEVLLAPELTRGELSSPRTDLYCWAVLVARLASGSDAPQAVLAATVEQGSDLAVPPAMRPILRSCLEQDPNERPPDAAQLLLLLEEEGLLETDTKPPSAKPAESEFIDLSESDMEVAAVLEEPAAPALTPPRPDPAPAKTPVQRVVRKPAPAEPTDRGRATVAKAKPQKPAAKAIARIVPRPEVPLESRLEDLALEAAREDPVGPRLDDALRSRAEREAERYTPPPEPKFELDTGRSPIVRSAPSRGVRTGPHGPPPRVMAATMFVLAALCVVLPAAHVLAERGPSVFAIELPQSEERPEVSSVPKEEPLPEGPPLAKGAGCPEGMVDLDAHVCISVAEHPGAKQPPTTRIGLRDAATACAGEGARLCRLAEWRKACSGPERWPVPYGPRIEQERCRTADIAGFPQEPAPAGSSKACVSPLGIFDLVGNVGEWVAEGSVVGGDGVTRAADATCALERPAPPDFVSANVGFRCCVDRL